MTSSNKHIHDLVDRLDPEDWALLSDILENAVGDSGMKNETLFDAFKNTVIMNDQLVKMIQANLKVQHEILDLISDIPPEETDDHDDAMNEMANNDHLEGDDE